MKIAVDQDDTIMSFTRHVLDAINREYGIIIDIEEITDWNDNSLRSLKFYKDGGNWWDWMRDRDWVWAQCPAIPGAIGGIQKLRDAGHRVELLTSKPEWAEWVTWSWLKKWRAPVHSVTIHPFGSATEKWELSSADILIDDGLHNVVPWVESGRGAIIFDQPWNRSWEPEGSVIRATSWQSIPACVDWMGTWLD